MADLTLTQMLNLLPDNTSGQISPQDMRDIITALKETLEGTNPVPGLQFDTTPDVPVHTPGHLHWDEDDGILEIMSGTAGVVLQVGHEEWVDVRNTTGSTITNGTPVKIIGATGNRPLVGTDDATGGLIGLATQDLANNGNGKVTSFGLVRDLNTSAFSVGDLIYVTAAGALSTAVSPAFVGTVIADHATQGAIFVHPASFDHPDGTTAARPTTVSTGYMYFDTTLGIPIWWSGAAWVNASGATV